MTGTSATAGGAAPGLLSRERIVAKPGFNRWLVPPAAVAIHLCIGMVYGLSVFWLPMAQAIGITQPVACPDAPDSVVGKIIQSLFTTTCDWDVTSVLIIFTIGIVFLGLSAAVFGGWLERAGPRKAGLAAAMCWGGGFIIAGFGMLIHQLWVIWLGLGVIGGIGLGLGYISPVSTLIKWFPDRRGMATGMAIMGFGGGAMIGSPLAVILMNGGNFINWDVPGLGPVQLGFEGFRTATSVGVWQTFMVMGAIYIIAMTAGAFGYRVPPEGWRPDGWKPPESTHAMITQGNVHLEEAHKTPQFWLIWIVLCMNVSAGIGVLAMASPMLQEIFAGSLIGLPNVSFEALSEAQKISIAAIAGGFVGLLSLFNAGGRFFWASMSDYIGRKRTYFIFFALGMVLYGAAPTLAAWGALAMFVAAFCIILSMYGGGFATVPAYLADIFGTKYVGAIHGRLLTAWSTAGVLGPMVIGYIRDAQLAAGIPKAQVYNQTMYILVGFLIVGLIANALVRPVHDKHLMKVDLGGMEGPHNTSTGAHGIGFGGFSFAALIAWLLVGIPFFWGVWNTLVKAVALFS